MTIPPLQSKIEASDVPMERLAGNPALSDSEKIAEATRQFEALLLRQILQSTQKPVFQSKYTDNSTTAEIYRDMVTNQLADSISKSGALGLAEVLHEEFTRQIPVSDKPEAGPAQSETLCTSGRHAAIISNPSPKAKEARL